MYYINTFLRSPSGGVEIFVDSDTNTPLEKIELAQGEMIGTIYQGKVKRISITREAVNPSRILADSYKG